MEELVLTVGKVFMSENGEKRRLIYIEQNDGNDGYIYLVRMDSALAAPVKVRITSFMDEIDKEFIKPIPDTFTVPDNISGKMRTEQRKRLELLKGIPLRDRMITDRKFFNEMVRRISKDSGKDKDYIKRIIHAFWSGGMTAHALYPRYADRGGEPGGNGTLTLKDIQAMEKIYRKVVLSPEAPSISSAYSQLLNEFYVSKEIVNDKIGDDGDIYAEDAPSRNQFAYFVEKLRKKDPEEFYKIRKGKKNFRLETRTVLGKTDYLSYAPGYCYFVDATKLDCCVVDRFDRSKPIGRPTIYFAIDGMSHMIVSIIITIREECFEGYALLLYYAFTDKKEFCRLYGVDQIDADEWPVHGLPSVIVADNSAMKSLYSNNIIEDLWISVENVEPARGDLKALVENLFSQINKIIIDLAPGKVTLDEGGNYVRRASVILPEIMKAAIDFTIIHNKTAAVEHTMFPDQMRDMPDPNPLSLWNWGMKNRAGCIRDVSSDIIKASLLPADYADIKENGLYFKGRHYYNQDALEKGWFTEARERSNRHLKKQKLRIHYREDDVGRLYYYDPCSREYMVFELCDYESYIADKVFFEEMIIYDEKTNAAKKKQRIKYQTGINRLRKRCKKMFKNSEKIANKDKKRAGRVRKDISSDHRDGEIEREGKFMLEFMTPGMVEGKVI